MKYIYFDNNKGPCSVLSIVVKHMPLPEIEIIEKNSSANKSMRNYDKIEK